MNDASRGRAVPGRPVDRPILGSWPDDPLDRVGLGVARGWWWYLYGLRALADGFASALSPSGEMRTTHEIMCDAHDRAAWPTRALRLGVHEPGAWSDAIARAPSEVESEWFVVPAWEDAASACRRHGLDAILCRTGEENLEILTNEDASREAAWYDWGSERPLSYASVFPTRVDGGRVSMPANEEGAPEARLVRLLLDAAGLLARTPARLGFGDRLKGRRPISGRPRRLDRFGPYRAAEDVAAPTMRAIAEEVERAEFAEAPGSALRAAARVAGAWLTTGVATGAPDLADARRRALLEGAARVTGDEAETLLRLAAARFAVVDDSAGVEALLRALRLIEGRAAVSDADQTAFLSSELEHGVGTSIALGRVAAGIGLACATMPVEKMAYFRDDLMDDARYSGWLVGRDPDRKFLMDVFDAIERARRGAGRAVRMAA